MKKIILMMIGCVFAISQSFSDIHQEGKYKCAYYTQDELRDGYKFIEEHVDRDDEEGPWIDCWGDGSTPCEFTYNPCEALYPDPTWEPLSNYVRAQVEIGVLSGTYTREATGVENIVIWDFTTPGECTIKETITIE